MKVTIVILGVLAAGFVAGLTLKDRLYGVGLQEPIIRLSSPSIQSPYHQIRLQSLDSAKSEGFVFLIEEEKPSEYLVFPKIGEKGVLRIEVVRK